MNPIERHAEKLRALAARGIRATGVASSSAASYVRAEASLVIQGPVEPSVRVARLAACMSCSERAPSTSGDEEVGYCRACGCGDWKRARLTVKATMPKATCPRGKWGSGVATSDGGNDAHTVYEEGDAGDEHG